MSEEQRLEKVKAALDQIDLRRLLDVTKNKNEILQQRIKEIAGSKHLSELITSLNALMIEIGEFQEVSSFKVASLNHVLHQLVKQGDEEKVALLIERIRIQLASS